MSQNRISAVLAATAVTNILAAVATGNFVNQHPEALPASFNTAEFLKEAALIAPLSHPTKPLTSLRPSC